MVEREPCFKAFEVCEHISSTNPFTLVPVCKGNQLYYEAWSSLWVLTDWQNTRLNMWCVFVWDTPIRNLKINTCCVILWLISSPKCTWQTPELARPASLRHSDVRGCSDEKWLSLTLHAGLRCRIVFPSICPNCVFHYSSAGRIQQDLSSPEQSWEWISNVCAPDMVGQKTGFRFKVSFTQRCWELPGSPASPVIPTAPVGLRKYYMAGTCLQQWNRYELEILTCNSNKCQKWLYKVGWH